MKKRRLCLIGVGVATMTLVGLLVSFHVRGSLLYHTLGPVRELPVSLIGPAFRNATGRELPSCVDDLRCLISGGMDPAIFVRFRTDSKGIEYVAEAFSGPDVDSKIVHPDANDPSSLPPSGAPLFLHASGWQEELGIYLFDRKSVKSGRVLEYRARASHQDGFQILIDDEEAIVYVYAYRI